MPRRSGLTLALCAFLMTGCYHQVVQTGATPAPGNAVVQKTAGVMWWGLAGAEVDTTAECPSGVATIETQQTFVNGLVGLITLGIYTPQTVTITCAAGEEEDSVPGAPVVTIAADASAEEAEAAARRAFELSSHVPVTIRDLR